MEILSFSSFGYEGEIIKVEADLRMGIPVTDIVGLPGNAVKEARERMRVAVRNSGLDFPQSRILINLSPADQKKEGSCFDLPIALSVLTAKIRQEDEDEKESKEEDEKSEEKRNAGHADTVHSGVCRDLKIMIMGELELSGKIRPVCGVLGAISAGAEAGIKYFIVPKENEAEASIPKNVTVFGAEDLKEAFGMIEEIRSRFSASLKDSLFHQKDEKENSATVPEIIWSDTRGNIQHDSVFDDGSFEDVRGQDYLIRALEIAAAGGHNLIAYGPPGCGKTLSLRRFQSLLPDMDFKTSNEVTRIYSVAGLLGGGKDILIKRPPFRMPHPNASLEGMIGGAGNCKPGEISLAHGGVLFLDEASQFKATVLQTLRAPLETGRVTLSRAGRSSTFPADFQLLLAINPCPCGNFGAEGKVCTCMPASIESYWKKLTAPLLDRIDLRIPVFPPPASALLQESKYSTKKLRKEIGFARKIQWERIKRTEEKFCGKRNGDLSISFLEYKNANLLPRDTPHVCSLTEESKIFFSKIIEKKKLSGRGSHAILKISRTIADLEQSPDIKTAHIEEAAALREWIKFLPDFL